MHLQYFLLLPANGVPIFFFLASPGPLPEIRCRHFREVYSAVQICVHSYPFAQPPVYISSVYQISPCFSALALPSFLAILILSSNSQTSLRTKFLLGFLLLTYPSIISRMHGSSRTTTDPRFSTMPGRRTSGFYRTGRHCLHQAQCLESRSKGELHPTKTCCEAGFHA